MANRTWSSAASTDMNDTANYSGAGSFATDDLIFDNTSVINAAATAGITANSITVASNYTGTWSLSGQTATLAQGFSDDGITGAHNYGNGITCGGASATFHSNPGGTLTASSCSLTLNGTTAMTLDIDKASTFKELVLGASALVTNTGNSNSTIFTNSGTLLTMGANSKITRTTNIILIVTANASAWSLGAGVTIDGASSLTVQASLGSTVTLPAATLSGTGRLVLSNLGTETSTNVFTLSGNLTSPGGLDFFNARNNASSDTTFNSGNYTINVGAMRFGGTAAAGITTSNFGSSAITVTSFDSTSFNTGTTNTLNFSTSSWTCTGAWTYGSTHTISEGTSSVTFSGTGATNTVTSNGKKFYDVTINKTATAGVTFADAASLHTLTASGTNTQAISWTGTTMTASGDITIDGSGTLNCGTAITMNGNSATLHLGSTLGAVTATSCALTMNGTTAMVLDDDKGVTFKSLTLGASAVVTNSGAASLIFSDVTPLTIGNNATFTQNSVAGIFLTSTATGNVWSIGTGVTFNGSGSVTIRINSATITVSIPAVTYTGTGAWTIQHRSVTTTATAQLTGNFNIGTNSLTVFNQNSSGTFDANDYNIACGSFIAGNGGTGTFNLKYGTGTHSISSFVGSTHNSATGTTNEDFESSIWTCTGAWTFGSNHTITGTAATTSVTFTNTTTITSNTKSFPGAFIVNAATKTITCADALTVADGFTLTAGTLTTATFNLTTTGNVAVNGTSTLNVTGSTCSFGGDYSTAAGSTVTTNAATNYTFTKNGAVLTTNGIALPQITMNSNFSINDTCTISRLIRVDGFTGTFEAGQTFTITNLAAANWSGAVGNLNRVVSSVPGTQFTIVIPNAATLTHYDSQDCIYQGFDITANDGTSITRGNNVRYLTFNVVTVLPITGIETGGTLITLTDTGNGMGGTCVVTVGGAGAGAETVVDTQNLTATTPAGAVGAANVVITNGDGDTRTLVGAFTYTAAPVAAGGVTVEARCWIGTGIGI